MAQIIFASGPEKGRVVPLGKETSVFGRDAGCSVRLVDPLTSRRHFVIEYVDACHCVSDKGSLNGTFLNGHRFERKPLNYGDWLQAGNTNLYFVSDEEAQQWAGLVGRELGAYRIQRRLGRGGRATVYLAEQISMQREVALKVLSDEFSCDESYVERFKLEAQRAGRLQNQALVQIYDVGEHDGFHFYSMEYFEQGCVQDLLCRRGCLSPAETVRILSDVARGLEYACSQKIVHRDIKPENLLVDQNGSVRIGDMGHLISVDEQDEVIGCVSGTPHFMAPEQAKGCEVDHRSDLYSLGCTGYKLLSGRYPFDGSSNDEVLTRQMAEKAVPLTSIRPDIPPALSRLIQKLMSKRPEDRYQTATALLEDLTPLLLTSLQASDQTSSTHTQVLNKLLSKLPEGPLDQTLTFG